MQAATQHAEDSNDDETAAVPAARNKPIRQHFTTSSVDSGRFHQLHGQDRDVGQQKSSDWLCCVCVGKTSDGSKRRTRQEIARMYAG